MQFIETPLAGAFLLEPERHPDKRGYFARMWDSREFADRGLCVRWAQSSVSYNAQAGTLRGMHYQVAPHEEIKLVTCVAGRAFDVIVDLRADSPTRHLWFATELSPAHNRTLYIPVGVAHGFMSLEDDTVMQYHISEPYHAESARGVRWDDPAFGIEWPRRPELMSQRDAEFPWLMQDPFEGDSAC